MVGFILSSFINGRVSSFLNKLEEIRLFKSVFRLLWKAAFSRFFHDGFLGRKSGSTSSIFIITESTLGLGLNTFGDTFRRILTCPIFSKVIPRGQRSLVLMLAVNRSATSFCIIRIIKFNPFGAASSSIFQIRGVVI